MIGIFDSGIGGLTVAKAVMEQLPAYDMIYFGDTARTPYGNKSPKTVIEYALEDTAFLLEKGAKIIVMACNTVSSLAAQAIAQKFDVPLFEVITPAVQLAVNSSKKQRFGVIGTRATVNSRIYEKKIQAISPNAKVYSEPCPLLVPLVEEGWLKKPETTMIVKKYLYPLKIRQIDTLILGCTHYPVLKKVIQHKIGKRVKVIDSSLAVAQNIKNFLKNSPEIKMDKTSHAHFFVSDVTDQFQKTAQSILKTKITLEHVSI